MPGSSFCTVPASAKPSPLAMIKIDATPQPPLPAGEEKVVEGKRHRLWALQGRAATCASVRRES